MKYEMEVSPPEGRGRTLDLTFYERDVNCYRHGGHMNYRKRPVVIQAERYDGTTESVEKIKMLGAERKILIFPDHLDILTLEGVHRADVGDFIVKGVAGELYPCKPDIFEKTYERA